MVYDPTATDDTPSFPSHLIVTVQKSYWSTPIIESGGKSDYDSKNQTKLYWVVSVDDCIQTNYEGKVPEKTFINWGIGKGWEADPSGFVVSHEDDKDKFKPDSGLGYFLSMIAGRRKFYSTDRGNTPVKPWDDEGPVAYDLMGAGHHLKKYCEDNNTTILDSRVWLGTQWETRGLTFNYGGEIGAHEKTMPVGYLGTGEAVDLDDVKTGKEVDRDKVAEALPPNTEEHVVNDMAKLLSTSATHTEFMKNALRLDDVKNDPALKEAVMNADTGPWSVR